MIKHDETLSLPLYTDLLLLNKFSFLKKYKFNRHIFFVGYITASLDHFLRLSCVHVFMRHCESCTAATWNIYNRRLDTAADQSFLSSRRTRMWSSHCLSYNIDRKLRFRHVDCCYWLASIEFNQMLFHSDDSKL